MSKLISIVLPVYNEEQVIPQLCKKLKTTTSRIKDYKFEIIMVENGSFDNSFNLLFKEYKKNKSLKIIRLVKNVGTDGALVAGLTYAKGDAAIVMMADLQEDPDLIIKFIKKWEEGYEIVYGIVRKRKKVSLIRKAETLAYYKMIGFLTHNLVIENASDFRLMDQKVYKLIINLPEHNKFFRGLVSWTGYKQTGIVFDRLPRYAGESKAYFSAVMKVALNGIFSFSTVFVFLPLFFSFISLIIFILFLLFKDYSIAIQSLMSTFLFLTLTIITEYVRRILIETTNRPHYILREKIGL